MRRFMAKRRVVARGVLERFDWWHLDLIQTLCTCLTDVRVGG